ncbi:MAG: hypothetical protein JXB44_12430 [Calditrichaceae bacterium]|nr:hypothetical protein [Calditrichaceae bacterium]
MINKTGIVFFLIILLASQVFAQWSPEEMKRIKQLSQEDHQLMMKLLGITELRPGPSGNPEAPNYANTDESKATIYDSLPDPLIFNDGKPVQTPDEWNKRKLELFEAFDREMYGRVPADTPPVSWEIISEKDKVEGDYPVTVQQLIGHADNSRYPAVTVDIQMILLTPKNINEPVPVIMEFGWMLPKGWKMPEPDGPTWIEQVLAKGWGCAILIPTTVQADNGAGLRQGIIGLVNKGQPRKIDDWGAYAPGLGVPAGLWIILKQIPT